MTQAVGDERAAGLVEDALARAEELVDRPDLRRDVLLDRRRALLGVYAAPSPPPRLTTGKSPSGRDRRDGGAEQLEVEELRADVHVQPRELSAGPREARRSPPRVGRAETELRVRLAGRDRLVGLAGTPGVTRSSTRCGAPSPTIRLEPIDLVEVVDDDVPDAHVEREAQLGLGLGVAVEEDALGVEAATQRQCSSPSEATSQPMPSSASTR